MFKRVSILLYASVMLTVVVFDPFVVRSAPFSSDGKEQKIDLSRGPMTFLDFPSKKTSTLAILLFGSGDGGWGEFEEAVSHTFQKQGYEVIGIDFNAYAKTDYDLDILQADYGKIAKTALGAFGDRPPPLIVGGYSMGAAQAIAAAGGPHPPQGLTGLLLIDPLSRGRYGLHSSDQMNVLPNGPGTFSADSFSATMGSLRVAQWHAENDSIDSRVWLDSLTAKHKLFIFPGTGHYYNNNREEFLRQLVESAGWIIDPASGDAVTAKNASDP